MKQFLLIMLISATILGGCTKKKANLKFLNTHTIFCTDMYNNLYPYEVSSAYYYTFSAIDLYGNFRYFDFYVGINSTWIEACSGYPIYTFFGPNNTPVTWNVTSHYKIQNESELGTVTPPAHNPVASTTIHVIGNGGIRDTTIDTSFGDIPSGTSQTGQFPISVTSGNSYGHTIILDPNNQIDERNENDNNTNGNIKMGRMNPNSEITACMLVFHNVNRSDVENVTEAYYIFNYERNTMELYNDGVHEKIPSYLK